MARMFRYCCYMYVEGDTLIDTFWNSLSVSVYTGAAL